MKKQDLTREAAELVRKLVREGGVIGSAEVLDCVPELMSSVVMDRVYIKNSIQQVLNRTTANPINALLKLVGLRIVRTSSEADNLSGVLAAEPQVEVRVSGAGNLDSFLKLNTDTFRDGLQKMADVLNRQEASRREARDADRAQYELAHGEFTRASAQASQLTSDYEDARRSVAERAQIMLGQVGPEGDGSPMIAQVLELLDDLSMKAYWSSADAPFTESAMFTTYKVHDTSTRRPRPCIVCDGAVLAKGLKFTEESAPDPAPEEAEASGDLEA